MSEASGPAATPVAVKLHRDQTIVALCDHFANDRLTVEEFERRLDRAHRATALPELQQLLSDLPVIETRAAPSAAKPGPVPAAYTPGPAPERHMREQQTLVAVMGGVEKRGRWQPARETTVVAIMGGGQLDFREVALPPGETEVTVLCIMGGVEIIVPPGMSVDTGGFAIMGGFGHRHDQPPVNDPNAPVLRINGFCLMGGVDLHVRLPGETPSDARHRERAERRRIKNERRGR